MRKLFFLRFLLLAFLAVSFALPQAGAKGRRSRQVVVMHTSDTHSRLDPIEENASSNAGLGGVSRRNALVMEQRKMNPDLLLLDAGDISQGTPYYNMYKGEAEIRAMNLLGYDAMCIGNHEFDFGMDNMRRLFLMADFPVVCANYDFTGTVLEDVVKPYVIIRRGGLKIGVFGLSPQLEGLVLDSACKGVRYLDPVQSAQRAVDALRGKGCDLVILISHLGVDKEARSKGTYDHNVIPKVSGIDLVLGGHTHTFMKHPLVVEDAAGNPVPVMHIGSNGIYVSRTVLQLEYVSGHE